MFTHRNGGLPVVNASHFVTYCFSLHRDNIPVLSLGVWEIHADYLDKEMLSGILPVLFAENPAAVEDCFRRDPITLRKDIEALQKQFFVPEEVTLTDALKVIKKPRSGDALFTWKMENLERLFSDSNVIPSVAGI